MLRNVYDGYSCCIRWNNILSTWFVAGDPLCDGHFLRSGIAARLGVLALPPFEHLQNRFQFSVLHDGPYGLSSPFGSAVLFLLDLYNGPCGVSSIM